MKTLRGNKNALLFFNCYLSGVIKLLTNTYFLIMCYSVSLKTTEEGKKSSLRWLSKRGTRDAGLILYVLWGIVWSKPALCSGPHGPRQVACLAEPQVLIWERGFRAALQGHVAERGNDAIWIPNPGPGGVLFMTTAPISGNEEQLARWQSARRVGKLPRWGVLKSTGHREGRHWSWLVSSLYGGQTSGPESYALIRAKASHDCPMAWNCFLQ